MSRVVIVIFKTILLVTQIFSGEQNNFKTLLMIIICCIEYYLSFPKPQWATNASLLLSPPPPGQVSFQYLHEMF
jgi:hypothetical protein